MIKRLLIAIVLLVVVCGGLVYFNMFRNQAIQDFFANRQQPAVPVQTVTTEPTVWQPGIETIGTASASQGIDLSTESGGVIESVNFRSNQTVEMGDVLVQIDDSIEQADLEAARAAVQLSEQTLQRAEELRERGVSAEANLEEARANAESARAQVARLEAILRQKTIRAPFDGTIGIPSVEEGQYVTPGTVVATLQDLSTMRVDFTVPEQQRNLLEIGQSVRLGAEEGEFRFQGEIIGIEPRINPNTRLVAVRAEVGNREEALNPGQFVRVRVQLEEEPDVIALPQTAVVTSLYGDYVYVVAEVEEEDAAADPAANPAGEPASGEAAAQQQSEGAGESEGKTGPALEVRQVFVELGRTNGSMIEIADGLSGGQRVVTAGQNRLSNGMPVTISENESPLEENTIEQVSR